MTWIKDNWQRLQQAVQQFGWEERLVIGLVGLAMLIAIAVYVVRRTRNMISNSNPSWSEHLSEFRRMRDKGEIDDNEFNRVVTTASRQHADAIAAPPKEPPPTAEGEASPTEGR
jgi:hypothetical protein